LKASIKAISYWLPEDKLSNEEISREHPEWSIEKISAKTGIYTRGITNQETFVSDIAVAASEKLFEEHKIDRNKIDFILLCTQSPDYFLPTTACVVQHRLGLPSHTGALDFNLGCSGYVYGLGLAKGLIETGIAKNILLITAETYSKYIHPLDKSNKTIFGDAAAATLISNDGDLLIGSFELGTDGSGADNLIVRNGAIRHRLMNGIDETDHETGQFIRNDNNLYMNGGEIFKFTAAKVPTLVHTVLEKNSENMDAIDYYVFHQANQFMLDFIRKKLGISEDKFFFFLRDCGNTVSSTIPIALSELLIQKPLAPGAKILLAGFGVGYSWGGCVLFKKDALQ
jgi:3-oxoacyl-[acyl-carrier-protein] synthase-3